MKAFITYSIINKPTITDDILDMHKIQKDKPNVVSTIGYTPHPLVTIDNVFSGVMYFQDINQFDALAVCITEAILPKSAIKHHISVETEKYLFENEMLPTKRQTKEWVDDYVAKTLPTCLRKDTLVEVYIDNKTNTLFIGTSSQRVADNVAAFLTHTLDFNFALKSKTNTAGWLRHQITNTSVVGTAAKIKNEIDGKTIAVKNDDGVVVANEFLKKNHYFEILELQFQLENIAVFTVTDKNIVKSVNYIIDEDVVDEVLQLTHITTALRQIDEFVHGDSDEL